MASLYRTWGSIGALIGVNIAIAVLGLDLNGNFLTGNNIAEAVMMLGIIGLLADLNLLTNKTENNFFKLGVIAFVAGFFLEILLFSSLLIKGNILMIFNDWIRISPVTIFLVGVPALYIAKAVAKERLIWGFDSTGKNGLIFVVLFTMLYAIVAMWALINFGVLNI